jgi:uncharacterized protein with von Willebrand factor type A (vWA) domain
MLDSSVPQSSGPKGPRAPLDELQARRRALEKRLVELDSLLFLSQEERLELKRLQQQKLATRQEILDLLEGSPQGKASPGEDLSQEVRG